MKFNSLNLVMIMGNLTKDPEEKEKKVDFTVASNERYKDSEGNWIDRADFTKVSAFGYLANSAKKYLKKGSTVLIVGKLRTIRFQKEGQKPTYYTYVQASEIIICGKSEKKAEARLTDEAEGDPFTDGQEEEKKAIGENEEKDPFPDSGESQSDDEILF
jgi:single-strand DNA-binding protein